MGCNLWSSSRLNYVSSIVYSLYKCFAMVSDKLFYVLLADDTNVFLNGKNINMLIDTIQQELSKLYV